MSRYYDINYIVKDMKGWYTTFIEEDNMAVGILRLRPNEQDPQEPHLYDEIYYIIKGDGYLRVNDEDIQVKEGRIIFVKAYTPHKFHSNTKEVIALYVFAGKDRDVSDLEV